MTENMNQNTTTDTTATSAENKGEQKTFSQEDVNRIVQDRLAKDRQKAAEEMSKKEQELAAREFRLNSRQKIIDRGYNENLLDALNCSSEEAFDKALDIIDNLIKERTPDLKQAAAEANKARFTTTVKQHDMRLDKGYEDPIRKAMRI